ncbi:YjgP/YjgQ family permease [Pelagibius litoralis]|uniref:YjgP/YjgQ family permease n=1 Tax=Pelagibius litoralis TaxID=374515 RepID=A0A967F1R9_9PROT|nr:LptF/LptG family permease [Pelagibius litoralis]NIA71495.1 YjgP/YjgQ family permease [Pelagibius litoralis]
MSTISSYLLRQTMMPLLISIGIALLVLLTERMLRLLDLVLDSQGGLTVLLQMLAYLIPHYMALALPAAFFLGVLLAFSRLHQGRELDALGSAGIGLAQMLRPILLLALGLTVVSAVNFSIGQPYARYTYRAMVHEVAAAAVNTYLQERTFIEVNGATFMANTVRRGSRDFGGVFVYEETGDGGTIVTTADQGSLVVAPQGERSTLVLSNGVRLEVDALDKTKSERLPNFDVLSFSQLQIPTNLVGQEAFRPRGEDERELTLHELWEYRSTPPPGATYDQMVGEFHDRLVRTFSLLFLPFLAVSFAIGPRRTHQAYGIAAGLLILIIYNQALSVGKSLTSTGEISPLIGQWLPLALLATVSTALFYRRAFQVTRGIGWPSPTDIFRSLLQTVRPGTNAAGGQRPE